MLKNCKNTKTQIDNVNILFRIMQQGFYRGSGQDVSMWNDDFSMGYGKFAMVNGDGDNGQWEIRKGVWCKWEVYTIQELQV